MRKLIPLLACLLTLLGLGVLVVQNTKAEAPGTSVLSLPGATQGSESARTGSPNGSNGLSQLGASSSPTTCIAYTYTLSTFDLPVVTATPGVMETTPASVTGTSTPASLPFAFTFYGVSYTSVNILNFGNLQFTTSNDSPHSCPFPFAQLGPSILPYWSEFDLHWGGSGDGPCVQNYGIPCGIYQTTTGIAPYRIYTVQWVGILYGSNHETVNFSARLYETTNVIDFVYDYGAMFGDYSAVGVQDGLGRYTAYTCNMSAQLQGRVIRWTPVITNDCATETPTSTPTITLTPTPTQTCPTSWVAVPSPTWSGTGTDQLTGVDALSSNNVWAVGGSSEYSGMVQHWDGTQWNAVPDDPPGWSEMIEDVDALSANDIWLVGWYGGPIGGTLTEHWDGTQWTYVLSPNGGNSNWAGLSSVSALAPDDVWAVGTTDRLVYGGGTPLIIHWNGTSWALVDSQSLQSNLYLRSVSAIAPDDVWAVGTYLVGSTMESQVAHWDGTAWNPSPIPTFGGTFSLYGVVGISANDVWAVGYTWTQTLTMHWDGAVWSVVPSPNPSGGGDRLYAVDARASDEVWAVGYYAPDGLSDRTLTMRWDGATWTIVSSPSPSPRSYYQSISVLPSGEAWTVGYNMVPSTTFSIVARYVPSEVCGTFTPAPSDTPTNTPTATQSVGTLTATATPTATATDTAVGTPSTPVATSTPCTINFSDVHTSDYFYEPVRYLYCEGVITGYPDNTFRPYDNASRGQLSKIVVLAEGMPIDTTGGPHFNDVLQGNPFYDYIETAYNAGLINGYADGSFRWSNDVTRGQICKIVVNAEDWTIDTSGGPHFPDVLPGSTFYDYVETAYHHSLVHGYPDGSFGPGNPATRGQIAKIVHNAVVGP